MKKPSPAELRLPPKAGFDQNSASAKAKAPARPGAAAKQGTSAPGARQKIAAPPAPAAGKPGAPPPAKRRRGWPILEAALVLVLIKMAAGSFYIWHRPEKADRESLALPSSAHLSGLTDLPSGPFTVPAPEAARPDYLGVALKAAQPAQAQAAPAPVAAGISALSAGALMVVGNQSGAGQAARGIPLPPGEEELLRPVTQPPQAALPRSGGSANPPGSAPGADFESLRSIREREQELARREALLANKAGALGALEAELNTRFQDAEKVKREIEAMLQRNTAILTEQKALAEQQQKEEEAMKDIRLEHLVAAYSGMKPEQAGILVNSMDDDVAVAILSAMPGGKAGRILAMVNPDKAARLTKAISEKRIDPNLLLAEEGAFPAF